MLVQGVEHKAAGEFWQVIEPRLKEVLHVFARLPAMHAMPLAGPQDVCERLMCKRGEERSQEDRPSHLRGVVSHVQGRESAAEREPKQIDRLV